MNAATKANLAELIERFALLGNSDPEIAVILGIKTAKVARLRREFGIAPGWTPGGVR